MSQHSVHDTVTMYSIREVGKNVPITFDRDNPVSVCLPQVGTYFLDEAERWAAKYQETFNKEVEIVRIIVVPMA